MPYNLDNKAREFELAARIGHLLDQSSLGSEAAQEIMATVPESALVGIVEADLEDAAWAVLVDDRETGTFINIDVGDFDTESPRRKQIRRAELELVMDKAAVQSGLDRYVWAEVPTDTGTILRMPADYSPGFGAWQFAQALETILAEYNSNQDGPDRLRLKVTLHHGVAMTGTSGRVGLPFTERGFGLKATARLAGEQAMGKVLEEIPSADLVVVTTCEIFEDIFHYRLGVGDHRKIPVKGMFGFKSHAHLIVPGHSLHGIEMST